MILPFRPQQLLQLQIQKNATTVIESASTMTLFPDKKSGSSDYGSSKGNILAAFVKKSARHCSEHTLIDIHF